MKKWLRGLICVLPAALFLSYYPLIQFGSDATMNFEISVPMIWLLIFDFLATIEVIRLKKYRLVRKTWWYLLLPGFVSLSLIWTANFTRGLLTVGLMWMVVVAISDLIALREDFKNDVFRETFWKWFFGTSVAACFWCVIQCILDITGVSRDYSLLCLGCTYRSFGFPHPNGFAIEPQFMGNLLLAPAIISGAFLVKPALKEKLSAKILGPKYVVVGFFIFVATLFLTFSRGAIYSFVVAMLFMSGFVIARAGQKIKKITYKLVGIMWGLVILAFVFTLNLQGIMSEIGPTKDTYMDGVSKVVSQLSLGIIDIKHEKSQIKQGNQEPDLPVENSVENSAKTEETEFDGYVPESTDTRIRLTSVALDLWNDNPENILFGVGIGGAGQALYDNSLIIHPKEIVQNEYASLLLETGVIGMVLAISLCVLVLRKIWKSRKFVAVVTLAIAYGISLCFFSGLANALHIYLLPVVLFLI